ncbi:MAG: chromosome segregation SMC family protein [Nitrosopumilaceae archaeon]
MVHIRKVEIFGFKSFGFKNTTINFDPGLVSISGPNGSGKSNILDAIMFALGENKPKMMRVDKLRSLIHDIEGGRHGPKIARTTVHFDNTDRKIPIDSNTVTITREMDDKGENIYYLNQKKTQRNHILDLLEVANSTIHQLNSVQQGTVTRISEFSPEEKRVAIENLIGLSYFDEKKTESLKQLDDSDRRLEIALARMDEIKKRIDELEVERNLKMRYDLIEKELARFSAIAASNKIRGLQNERLSKERNLNAIASDSKKLEEQRNQIRKEIKELDGQKNKFLAEADDYNQAKAKLESELANAREQYDKAESAIAANTRRLEQIDSRLPEIHTELESLQQSKLSFESQIMGIKDAIKSINDEKHNVNDELTKVNSERNRVLREQSQTATKKTDIDRRIKTLSTKLNNVKLSLSENQSELNSIIRKIKTNSERSESFLKDVERLENLRQKLEPIISYHKDTIKELKLRLSKRSEARTQIEKDIDDTALILEKASKAAAQYEAKIRVVKEIMHEDYSIAKLKEDSSKLGIQGLVYEMLSWDKQYERPILAAGSDWIKALVVKDFATLVGLSEFAKQHKLPKLRIIPLDAIPNFDLSLPKEQGVVGLLSDFVRCKKQLGSLKNFIFGSIILVDSRETACKLSRSGYRTVTTDGQFFEAKTNAVIVDINSKISNLTKIISTSTSVDGLKQSLELLKKFIQKKKARLKKMEEATRTLLNSLHVSENGLTNSGLSYSELQTKTVSISRTRNQLSSRILQLERQKERLLTEAPKLESYISSLEERISIMEENYAEEEQARIANSLSNINESKSDLESKQSSISAEYREKQTELAKLTADENTLKSKIRILSEEKSTFNHEKNDIEIELRRLIKEKENAEVQLVPLREKEQQLISTSGTSVSTIKEFDDKLKIINDKERSLTSEINAFGRQSDLLSRDIRDLTESEDKLRKALTSYGYDETIDSFDVYSILESLEGEKKSLVGSLNTSAPDKFMETSNGYRSMSQRKNELEEERNAIVRFIEGIDKEKRQTFLEAYDKVDKEIREAFNLMTGGQAWLELQDEDNIFSSGISYLLQFPNKPKRESTSISGGEKTLAAIVYVLALQKLKPSPFYLFDEIDAHLDGPNSERLSKIVEQRSRGSQFIMVSLKDTMVQKAQLIYGVYPKNGVSHVVTYKDKRLPSIAN